MRSSPRACKYRPPFCDCRLASRAMAVTNRVSANEVMSDGDLAKQYKSELSQLRDRLSRQESGEEQSMASSHLKHQVSILC